MNKIILPILLCSTFLVSCGTIKQPDENKDDSNTTEKNESETTNKKTTWTDEESQLMKTHLNNTVLPFLNLNEGTWYYDSEYDCMSYETSGNKNDVNKLTSEIEKIKDWVIDVPASQQEDIYGSSSLLETSGENYIDQIILDIYTNGTSLELDAYYQRIYNGYDEKAVQEAINEIGGENYVLPKPEFEMNYFVIDKQGLDLGYVTFACGTDSDMSNSYKAQLDNLKYKTTTQTVEDQTFEFKIDPVSNIAIETLYDETYKETWITVYVGIIE